MTPGDDGTPEPYWYVTPWPCPEAPNLPSLEGQGKWHTEDWLGALLTASAMSNRSREAQAEQVQVFLESAIQASLKLIT